jgi:hypothetical protein
LSLLEVLFSMGILLVGLMGVAAMIPAGRHEILQGTKVDHATAVGRAAFRDLKIREYLEPERWVDSTGTDIYFAPNPPTHLTPWFTTAYNTNTSAGSNPDVTPAVAIDPLGLGDPTDVARTFGASFPYLSPVLPLARIFPDRQFRVTPANAPLLADPIFRNADDLIFVPNPTLRDGSPVQQLFSSAKRGSVGDYSWLATVVTDPSTSALGSPVNVSVAVFHKRDFSTPGAGEAVANVVGFPGSGIGGGDVLLDVYNPSPGAIGKFPKGLKPGQWIMLAGSLQQTTPPATLKYYRWYRVVAADIVRGNNQVVTLAGPDWDIRTNPTVAFLFDNIIAVYEKNMRLDFE